MVGVALHQDADAILYSDAMRAGFSKGGCIHSEIRHQPDGKESITWLTMASQ